MYYHVLIETNERIGGTDRNKKYFLLDKTNLLELEEDVIIPYLKKELLQFDGYFLKHNEITRLVVKESERTTKEYSEIENRTLPANILIYISPEDILGYDYLKDITKKVFMSANERLSKNDVSTKKMNKPDYTKVFIVHGHDELAKTELARFIERLGFEAIILHEQVNSGNTIIEKLEEFSNVEFGVVLYTACDIGSKKGHESSLQPRARQNVVFEHGYLISKLGRRNVSALVKGNVETPTDVSGVVYIPMDDHKAWHLALAKELRHAGYNVDMNRII